MENYDTIDPWVAITLAAIFTIIWFVLGSKARREARKARKSDNAQ